MRHVYLCVLLVVTVAFVGMFANAADGDGGLDGPTGQHQSPEESDDEELDLCQMYDLCVNGCEGSRQMAYWDCYNVYQICVENRNNCQNMAKQHPASYHCFTPQNSIKCEMDHFQCQMTAEGAYNACEGGCQAQYPNCS